MESKEARGFPHNIYKLSKKELQELSRTYGLSPYKTKPNLVNSLISYFKVIEANLLQGYDIRNSTHISSKRRGTSGPGYVSQRDKNGLKYKEDSANVISFENSNFSFVREAELSEMSQSRPRGSDSLAKNVVASAVKSTPIPSFEFSVRSDEGINLVVDLNSSPSDWPNMLENGICLCHSFCKGKLQNFCKEHQNLENGDKQNDSSFNVARDSDTKSNCACTGSSPRRHDIKNGDLHPAEDDGLIGPSKTNARDGKNGDAVFLPPADYDLVGLSKAKPCSPAKGNKERPPLFRPNSDADSQIVRDPKPMPVAFEPERADLDFLRSCTVKEGGSSKSNLVVEAPANSFKDQHMQLYDNHVSINKEKAHCLDSTTIGAPVSPIIGVTKIQSSETTHQELLPSISHPPSSLGKSVVDSVPTVGARGDGPADFGDVNHTNYLGQGQTSAEQRERTGSANQQDDPDKLGRKSEVCVSDQARKRKAQDIESEKHHDSTDGRILRSRKRTQGHNLRRRSTRLVSK